MILRSGPSLDEVAANEYDSATRGFAGNSASGPVGIAVAGDLCFVSLPLIPGGESPVA